MPNKNWDSLDPFDKMLRQKFTFGMDSGTQLIIQKVCGFELFNTRPYHNYETWSDGYHVTDGKFKVQMEDLDDAINKLLKLRNKEIESHNYDLLRGSDFPNIKFQTTER